MGAGALRELVTFEYRASVDDGYGNVSGAWTPAFPDDASPPVNKTFFARIKPLRGGETVQAARLAGKQPVVVTVRSSSQSRQVRVEWRLIDARLGTIYNVRSIVNPDEKGAFLDMECEAGVAT